MENLELQLDIQFLLPKQKFGNSCDNMQFKKLKDDKEARYTFEKMKVHFADINNWGLMDKKVIAKFDLKDKLGRKKQSQPSVGDYIKVKLGGFKNLFYGGGDWVKITELQSGEEEGIQYLKMTLTPTSRPKTNPKKTAHFLKSNSSNTFIIAQRNNIIQASVHGRNETLNTEENVSAPEKTRNIVIGKAGFIGLNSFQWQGWCDGIIETSYS